MTVQQGKELRFPRGTLPLGRPKRHIRSCERNKDTPRFILAISIFHPRSLLLARATSTRRARELVLLAAGLEAIHWPVVE